MQTRSLLNPPVPHSAGQRLAWPRLPGSALALALTRAAASAPGLLVAVSSDSRSAQVLESDLHALADEALTIKPFPDWEILPYDLFSPHPDIVSDRLQTLYELGGGLDRGILVVTIATLMQRLTPKTHVRGTGLQLTPGQHIELSSERTRLEQAGYRCVSQVCDHGEFAVRGAILDLFPNGAPTPFRIELFDDQIETIRSFDPETQISIEKVDGVALLPAHEYPFDQAARSAFQVAYRNRFEVDLHRCPLYQDVKQGIAGSGIESYLPLFFPCTETLFDYLPKTTVFALAPAWNETAQVFWQRLEQRYEQHRHDVERPILQPAELFLPPDQLAERLSKITTIEVNANDTAFTFACEEPPQLDLLHGKTPATTDTTLFEHPEQRVLIAVDSPGRREVVADQLAQLGHRPVSVRGWSDFLAGEQSLAIAVAPIASGFVLRQPALSVLSERELFGDRARQSRRQRRSARDPNSIIRDLTDLHIGAPVVHETYGVGRYLGLQRIDAGGLEAEFLTIEYAKGDKLYVPVADLHMISRYTGGGSDSAPMHRLGSDQWDKAKRKAAQRVRDVAAELLDVYARREAAKGEALSLDPGAYAEFAAGFPFEETADQTQAIGAVIEDLTRQRPMDRVVCGDVGFGKTEVALRAAFITAHSGKQVAVLVPTTLLAQQHAQNFLDRFANTAVRVEALSRFRTKADADRIKQGIADGQVDIVIGTHRLLQKDIRFKDLSLVIVDEEQRFGVRQKERLKALRAQVNLLTLTATPIPRTLNMSLTGLRDLSLIATAPANRVAVKTFVGIWDPILLRDAFSRELQRGGQVFFLHNEVQSIERMADELTDMFPDARIRVAHGQMPERELEQVMLDFYRQRFNVLVCTTIIESGIDIPSANTIVINRADRFGLAQLHQLRGRVGRSHHRAYAYLVVPPPKAMTADARKRLQAIEALEELGAGFTLSTHDLEIRGAGELLGEEQSGQIQQIGFALYSELLERAVQALKAGQEPNLERPLTQGSEVDLGVAALIPDNYLPDVHSRLVLYKRIASAANHQELRDLQVEMIDRFGLLPEQTKNLFSVAELKLRAGALGIEQLKLDSHSGRIVFGEQPTVDPAKLVGLVQTQAQRYRFDGQQTLRISLEMPAVGDRVETAQRLLSELAARDAA